MRSAKSDGVGHRIQLGTATSLTGPKHRRMMDPHRGNSQSVTEQAEPEREEAKFEQPFEALTAPRLRRGRNFAAKKRVKINRDGNER